MSSSEMLVLAHRRSCWEDGYLGTEIMATGQETGPWDPVDIQNSTLGGASPVEVWPGNNGAHCSRACTGILRWRIGRMKSVQMVSLISRF